MDADSGVIDGDAARNGSFNNRQGHCSYCSVHLWNHYCVCYPHSPAGWQRCIKLLEDFLKSCHGVDCQLFWFTCYCEFMYPGNKRSSVTYVHFQVHTFIRVSTRQTVRCIYLDWFIALVIREATFSLLNLSLQASIVTAANTVARSSSKVKICNYKLDRTEETLKRNF